MSRLQNRFPVVVQSPLGEDKFRLLSLRGEEHLSRPFRFHLELLSDDATLALEKLVGKGLTTAFALSGGETRYLHGVVTRFAQEESAVRETVYRVELRPWLWMLTLERDCRIFQNKTAPQILEALFKELGFTDFRNALKATYPQREYCVQYRERTFDFVSRLMEEEGIFYFFEHEQGKHTLVLADDSDSHPVCPGLPTARFGQTSTGEEMDDVVTRCLYERRVSTEKYALGDYNFEVPATTLHVNMGKAGRRIYDYPGGFMQQTEGERRARLRLESREAASQALRGVSGCRAFTAGHRFTLAGHSRNELNQQYVLRSVTHAATQSRYSNRFTAFPLDLSFRPPQRTPRPVIAGTQTAQVVGKAGEEIWTDKYGRVKVQFHWDQLGQNDEKSSCWVRVAQGWAGKGWGSIFTPRIGQEVIVSFLDGDPDRPLVTGAVYNGQHAVPYALPDQQTRSTVKSSSSKGAQGSNEIRFEDKQGSEEMYLHAQKDYKLLVENDRTDEVTRDETHTVKGKRTLTITGAEKHTNEAAFEQSTGGNYTLKVSGNLVIEASGSVSIKAGTSLTSQAGTELSQKAGTNLKSEAGVGVTTKGGATQTVESGGLLTIKGSLVKIN